MAMAGALPSAASSAHAPGPGRMKLITWLVTGSMFMETLDGSIINTALPTMARSFGRTAIELNPGVSAYMLALGVFIPASGWVAERFGARTVFALAIAIFTLSSALCGMAGGLEAFIAVRVVQGISGAMMVPVGRLVVLKYTPKDKLMAAMSSLVWPALIAPVIGPPLGGFITAHFGWRWIFYLNVPLGVAALALAVALVPNITEDEHRPFDWPGFALSGLGTFGLLLGLERLAQNFEVVNLSLSLGGAGLLLISVLHFLKARAPMVDLSVFSVPTFRVAMASGSAARMAVSSAPFLLPLMFQEGFGMGPFQSGLLLLWVFAGNLGIKAVTTRILRRFGYRNVLIGNGALCVLSLLSCGFIDARGGIWWAIPLLVMQGMTRSMQFTTLGTIAYADVPKPRMSDANSLFNTMSQTAMAAGITLAAIGVHLGQQVAPLVAGWLGEAGWAVAAGPVLPFRLAFGLSAAVALLGVFGALRLPRGAGDHFVDRG